MAEFYQLDFLQSDDVSLLEQTVEKNFNRLERVRKRAFAKINELEKKIVELELRLAIMERNICKGKNGYTRASTIQSHEKPVREADDFFSLLAIRGGELAGST